MGNPSCPDLKYNHLHHKFDQAKRRADSGMFGTLILFGTMWRTNTGLELRFRFQMA